MLFFYYGVMGSSKTAQLLMQRYNYQQLGLRVALVKPAIDTRAGENMVYSRVGLKAPAELVLENGHSAREQLLWLAARNACSGFEYVFVDEAQFLTPEQVQELADMAEKLDIFCYGLKTDFQGNFFPGSAALLRLAEEIHEVPGGLCWCGAKATMNTRIDPEGNVVKKGQQVLIDNQQAIRYIGLCYKHWRKGISHA
ncbi:MAG: thymidine kinase [Eubacteriales bacterium]|jgi:thymidine kinase|nr:thymidine kinase [Eubacteriales bacterium]MDD3110433.1 thymidine kinase [Eubacteriales bacterium]MDD3572795.1 thymidine kinase [Eubacteriales bacterium]MDD4133767.1 thymidine kinase [Eubacteriales bacterium]NLO12908.1 thymidine kinase [Clostridiales bacterium]